MLNFSFVLFSLFFYVLFLFLGLGLTILFCPKELRKYTIFLSPIIGYCFLTLAGWYFYSLNFKGTDEYYIWVLLLSFSFLIAALFKIWKQGILSKLFNRELIIPILIAIIVFLAVAFPSLRQEEMTVISLGNNDVASYALASKIVKEIPKNDAHRIIDYYFVPELALGGFIGTAFFCSVAKLDPYQVQMISIYVLFIISLFLTYILAREVFIYSSFAASAIILLYGFNSLLYYVIYQGFENQIIAVPLMLLTILFNVAIVRVNKFNDAIRYVPFLFFSLWGLSLTYSHMLVIIYTPVIAYILASYWKNRKVAKLLNWIASNCIALLVIICLSPQRLQMVISNTRFISSVTAGWFIPWITPQKLFGITSFLSQNTADITITVFLIVVVFSGFVKLYRSHRENFLFSLIMVLLIFIGALILSIQSKANEGFGGYKQFKLISFFLPLLLLSSFAIFRDITFNIRSSVLHPIKSSYKYVSIRKNTLYFLLISALVISNCLSAGKMLYTILKNVTVLSPDTVNLQGIKNRDEIKSINIPADESGSYWNIVWEAYFLFPKKLFFEQQTYYASTPLNGEWWLIRNTETVLSISLKSESNIIPINSTYILRKSSEEVD